MQPVLYRRLMVTTAAPGWWYLQYNSWFVQSFSFQIVLLSLLNEGFFPPFTIKPMSLKNNLPVNLFPLVRAPESYPVFSNKNLDSSNALNQLGSFVISGFSSLSIQKVSSEKYWRAWKGYNWRFSYSLCCFTWVGFVSVIYIVNNP